MRPRRSCTLTFSTDGMGLSKSKTRREGSSPGADRQCQSDYPDRLHKLVLVGDSATGKTSLLLRFEDDTFRSTYIPTIVEPKVRTIEVDGVKIKLQIWDTAGLERFRTISTALFRGASGMIGVYDVTREETFEHVPYWVDLIRKNGNADSVVVMLVGNKCDLEDEKKIQYDRGRDLAEELGTLFFETSCKDGTNVELAFVTLVTAIEHAWPQ